MEFFSAPLVIEIISIFFAALVAFLGGQYIIKPRRCEHQMAKCAEEREKLIASQNNKRAFNRGQIDDSLGAVKADLDEIEVRVERIVDKIDSTYVRRDAIVPRLEDIFKEVSELRGVIYKFLKTNGHGGKSV
jgi:uncharacterized coiled-coil DUF342 family protein